MTKVVTSTYETISRNGNKIAVITLDNAPVNSLSFGVRDGIQKGVQNVQNDSEIKGVIIRGSHKTFCAGADISEFSSGLKGPSLPELIYEMESLNVPVVASIEKFALGGGLELALGAHYRVCESSAKLGLPEVNLGLLPGAGGTQRLPRISGLEFSLKLIVGGRPVSASSAHKAKLVDKVINTGSNLFEESIKFLIEKIGTDVSNRRVRDLKVPGFTGKEAFDSARKMANKMRRGELAPLNIIKALEASVNLPFDDGMNEEFNLFMELAMNPQSRALQHMFFAERQANKITNVSKSAKAKDIKKLGIIGAGLMGGGIAMCAANARIEVILLDINEDAVKKGMNTILKNYQRSQKRGKLTQEQVDKKMSLIKPTTNYNDLKDVDMVIEAVFENMNIKKQIFSQLDKVCKQGAFLCSNTSYLNIDEIASVTNRPELVAGTHFFSPANVMLLLENIKGKLTNDETILTIMAFGKKIRKVACLVGNCHGFVGNRMIEFYSKEASSMIIEGALPQQVDKLAYEFGMPMGPFQMIDLVGLDLGWRERKRAGTANPELDVTDALCEIGRLGQKTGKGYYIYDENRKPIPDSDVEKIIKNISKNKNITRRSFSDDEIIQRLFYPLINEGFKILEEGIAQRPSDIDVIYCYGYGFPRYRGGPMKYADEVGLSEIANILPKYGYEPSKLLIEAAGKGSLQKLWKAKLKAKL